MSSIEIFNNSHRKLTPAHITFTAAPYNAKLQVSSTTWLNDKIAKKIDDQKGIHYVAEQPVKSGETLLNEEPFIRHFEHADRFKYCSYCFRSISICLSPNDDIVAYDDSANNSSIEKTDSDSLIECRRGKDCSWMHSYCSAECEERNWTEEGHSWLCRFPELCDEDPTVLLALTGYIKSRSFGYDTLPGLVSNREAVNTEDLDNYRKSFMKLAATFYLSEYVVNNLLTIYLQIKCNSFAIKGYSSIDELYGKERYMLPETLVQNRDIIHYGRGIYLQASRLNHSCKPNSLASFGSMDEEEMNLYGSDRSSNHGSNPCRLTVHSVKGTSLSAGEEITISYGPLATRQSRSERLAKLRNDYYFDCQCTACADTQQDPFLDTIYLCPKCKEGKMYKNQARCLQCGEKPDWASIEKIENDAYRLKSKGDFETALKLQKSIYHGDTLNVGETLDKIAQQYCLQGQFGKASQYVKQSLQIIQKVYGKTSIEAAEEMMKLATLYYNSGQANEGLKHAKATLIVYRILGLDKTQPGDIEELKTMMTLLTLNAAAFRT
ncbi:hypothetical protein BDF20DRAFT_913429 [Mycotypha africana]|uniref:uncharacterized protein n=1 Tax=Mycotypha africana TaxID=64632 RepID=UPI0022FFD5A2|nr:uncharacterized protein BDF20DRAFT_913429 [Mycotypha africana]KAI8977051.1 hypothetical protein BDF20DRAFT_913429 [Mycotypha africana]